MSQIIFHIGFHKTGTTYLQEKVFPFALDTEFTRHWESLSTITRSTSKSFWLHSDESISGNPWGSEIPYNEAFYRNIQGILNQFNNPKFIVGVRNLNTWTESLWRQYIHEGGILPPSEFFSGANPIIPLESCMMADKISWLKSKAETLVISQEELRNNPNNVINRISDYTGITFDLDAINEQKEQKELNVGVRTTTQVNFLVTANKIEQQLKAIHPKLILFYSLLKRFGITPRYIAQNMLGKFNSQKYLVDFRFNDTQKNQMETDWEEVSTFL